MAYDVTTITLKGADLLASASASDDLILVGCDATQQFINKPSAIQVENRPANPFSTTSNVRLGGSTDNHLFIRAFFVAGESTGGAANSLYIYGHKASDPLNDYVIAIMSSVNPFHLPEVGDISNTYGVLLDIIYNPADGSVSQVTSSVYATYGEYADLRDRAVTTHKQGQTTVGDDQTIYGEKTFKSQIISDTGSFGIVDKHVGENFETYYGDFMGEVYTVGSDNVTYAYTGLNFLISGDKHSLSVAPSSIIGGGVSRKFGISSETDIDGNQEKLSEVSTFLNKNVVQQGGSWDSYETGRVLIQATEPKDYQSAKIDLTTGYDENENGEGNINITTTNFSLQADDMTGNDKGNISLYAADEISIRSLSTRHETTAFHLYVMNDITDNSAGQVTVNISGNYFDIVNSSLGTNIVGEIMFGVEGNDSYSLYPRKTGASSVNLGKSNYPWDDIVGVNIWATTFHGNLNGNAATATKATKDVNNNDIVNYIYSGGFVPDSTALAFTKGNGTDQTYTYLNSPLTVAILGKTVSSDTPYASTGGIGLFFMDTPASDCVPGTLVAGSSLAPAAIQFDSNDRTLTAQVTPAGTESGTWALLTSAMSVTGKRCIVLAVKVSNENPT